MKKQNGKIVIGEIKISNLFNIQQGLHCGERFQIVTNHCVKWLVNIMIYILNDIFIAGLEDF